MPSPEPTPATAEPGGSSERSTATTPASSSPRSDLEILFKELCRAHALPTPLINQPIAGKIVDFLFADHRLIVETDSWRFHKTRRTFEADRARDILTTTAGYRTLRFTDRHALPSAADGNTVG